MHRHTPNLPHAACEPAVAEKLLRELDAAEAAASKDQVARRVALTQRGLLDAIDNIRGAVRG
jgi:hypothetical protein